MALGDLITKKERDVRTKSLSRVVCEDRPDAAKSTERRTKRLSSDEVERARQVNSVYGLKR